MDFVNGFVDFDQLGGPHIEAAANQTVALLAHFRQHQLPVVHTRVVFEADGANRVQLRVLTQGAKASSTCSGWPWW